MPYRCVAASAAGFIQQLAVAYVTHGYYFYVTGHIPARKDPALTDRKIIAQYGLDVSKWARARRKKAGAASVQYLRWGSFFVIVATHGEHPFFAQEGKRIRDFRRQPLYFVGYSIGCRRGRDGQRHASVRIAPDMYRDLRKRFADIAVHRTVSQLVGELRALDYEAYAPVREQLHTLLRAINRRRRVAGLEPVPPEALRLRRGPIKPFDYP